MFDSKCKRTFIQLTHKVKLVPVKLSGKGFSFWTTFWSLCVTGCGEGQAAGRDVVSEPCTMLTSLMACINSEVKTLECGSSWSLCDADLYVSSC